MELTIERLLEALQQSVKLDKTGGVDPSNGSMAPYGQSSQLTWTKFKESRKNGLFTNVRVKETELTPFTNTMYGCTGIFGICGPDEIIGMTMKDDPLVEWLGFFPDTICEKFIKGLTYMDQQGTGAGTVVGTIYGAACDDPPTSEKGVCEFFIGDFGTLRGCGEAIKISDIGLRKCDKQPTYTLPIEGVGPVRIDNDLDLESISAAQMVKHELSRLIVTGDKQVAGQFDGLVNLVRTGYMSIDQKACTELDSVVVDWENDDLAGAVNGHGNIITKIRDVFRRIMQRINWSSLGRPAEGDMVLVMPSWMAWAVLDEWAFWTFHAGAQYNEISTDKFAMNQFREKYATGLYGGGYITIDGFNLHIIPHDWQPIAQDAPNFCTDIYLLTRRLGTMRVFQGQYVPVDQGAAAANALGGSFTTETMQGGRVLRWVKTDNACVKPCLLLRPRLYCPVPWAQGVIQNVCHNPQFAPLSPDPASDYFVSSKTAVEHVVQYFYNPDVAGDAGDQRGDGGGWFN